MWAIVIRQVMVICNGKPQRERTFHTTDRMYIWPLFSARFTGQNGSVDGQQQGDVQSGGGAVTSAGGGGGGVGGGVVGSGLNAAGQQQQHQQQQQGSNNAGNAANTNANNGAGAWGDEIDFDLNNDLSSNGYMK